MESLYMEKTIQKRNKKIVAKATKYSMTQKKRNSGNNC
jgi:hypothetical protein